MVADHPPTGSQGSTRQTPSPSLCGRENQSVGRELPTRSWAPQGAGGALRDPLGVEGPSKHSDPPGTGRPRGACVRVEGLGD